MVNRTIVPAVLGVSAVIAAGSCTWVRPVHTPNTISHSRAAPSGTPRETLDQLETQYPPGYEKPASIRSRVAVGPICLSSDAVLAVLGETPEVIEARARAGTARAVTTIRRGEDELFFFAVTTSMEVQAVIVEHLVNHGSFRAYALKEDESRQMLDDRWTYQQMHNEGIRYYVAGTVVAGGDTAAPRVRLRLTDTATREILCAASGEGRDLSEAADHAAASLTEHMSRYKKRQNSGG